MPFLIVFSSVTMNRIFAYNSNVRYRDIDSPAGPRLHFISSKTISQDLISVSITVGFGGIHLRCNDRLGRIHEIPQGMAHFMEHLLFWLHIDEYLRPISDNYGASPNCVVTYDRTIWYVKGAFVDKGKGSSAACDIVEQLISVLVTDDQHKQRILKLLKMTVNDIRNEIAYRHGNLDYVMRLKLLEALYHENPIRYDMLGSTESLTKIGISDVELALSLIRSNIASVTVCARVLSDETIAQIEQLITGILNASKAEAELRPVPPSTEPLDVKSNANGVQRDLGNFADCMVGVKLLPMEQAFPNPTELVDMWLVSHIVTNYFREQVNAIISRTARAYIIRGYIDDDLFFLDEGKCSAIVAQSKAILVQRLKKYRDSFAASNKLAYESIMTGRRAYTLMQLCQAADLFGYKLTDVLNRFESIQPELVDRLIVEINGEQENVSLVYAGRYVDLL